MHLLQKDFSLIMLLRTLFDGFHRFVLIGDLNAGYADYGTLLCKALQSSFVDKLVDLVQELLMLLHVREPTSHYYDAPPHRS